MNAIRSFGKHGKATIEVTFDDGTTAKIGGKRAARAAAVVAYRLGDRLNSNSTDLGEGWGIEGARQSIHSAHSLINSIVSKSKQHGGTYYSRQLLEIKAIVVTDSAA